MSENINIELHHEEGKSLLSMIALFIKLELLVFLVALPFSLIAVVLEECKLYEACMFLEISGSLVSYFYVVYNHCKKENFKLKIEQKFPIRFLLYMLLLLIGFRLFYDTTLGVFLDRFEVSESLVEASELWYSAQIFGAVSVCIIAPIVEEFLYRGVLLEHMRKRYNPLTAVIVSSLFFGIAHLNLHQGVNAFFIGLCLGVVYIKTNSLLASIFFHLANNTLVMMTSYPFVDIYKMRPQLIAISAVFLVISLLLISRTKIDENKKFHFRLLGKHNLVQ